MIESPLNRRPKRSFLSTLFRWCVRAVVAVVLIAFLLLSWFRWQAHRREILDARTSAPASGQFVEAGGLRIFVQQLGPADGPAVLFVHGTGAWSETWRESMQATADAGFHAIALDLPPFGFSQRPAGAHYSRPEQAGRILGVLDALHVRKAILVGHSFGAGATMEAVFIDPARIQGVVLVDGALGLKGQTDADDSGSPVVRGLLAATPLRNALVATFLTNPGYTEKLLQKFVDNPAAATPAKVRIYQQPLALEGSTVAIGDWLPVLVLPDRGSKSDRREAYRTLQVPVRLIWGAKDRITPLDQGVDLAQLLPRARLVSIEGIGHIPQIEDSRRFSQALVGQLDDLRASGY